THIEWSSTWEATGSSGPEAWAELWARTVERADQRMGGGRLSLVGAIERAAAGLDALDPQALQVKPEDRETTALDQSAADGPTTGGPEEPTEAADLRAHQAGLSAEASHPGEDRSLGREVTRLHGNRSVLAFWEFGRRRVRLSDERHRPANDLDGAQGGARQ